MTGLRPSAMTVKVAAEICHLSLVKGVRILASLCIGSFVKVRNCGLLISHT